MMKIAIPDDYQNVGSENGELVRSGRSGRNHRLQGGQVMSQTIEETNKRLVLEAFDTLFNKRDYKAAERLWSANYIQHSVHIPPGREGLFDLIRSIPPTLRYEAGVMLAEGDSVMVHGRFSGIGQPANWIVVDIVRLEDGVLAEHWDVLQDEASKESSRSGLPMFGDAFPARQSGAAERPAHRDARAVESHAQGLDE